MNKKLLSIAMAMLLAAAPAAVAANAADTKVENLSGEAIALNFDEYDVTDHDTDTGSYTDTYEPEPGSGTIKFDMGDWNHSDKICFYIWANNGEETLHCANDGWEYSDNWGSKRLYGTNVEGEDGIVESYPFTIPYGYDVFVIFHDMTTGAQTYDCIINESAFGDTAYMTGNLLENPLDSEKQSIEVKFRNSSCGPYKQITSTGNIIGEYSRYNENVAAMVAEYVFNRMGQIDKSGEECCNAEKVAAAIESFGTTADDVWAEFKKFESKGGYTYKVDEAKSLIFGTSNEKLLGDVNGDSKVTATDAMLVQRYAVKLASLDDAQMKLADVNGDGKVTAVDAMQILRYTIHLNASEGIGELVL